MTGAEAPGVVVVRGAGDIATGAIQKLVHAGFDVVALEVSQPMAIRWRAALCPAVVRGRWVVEDLVGVRAGSWAEAFDLLVEPGTVPVLVDPAADLLTHLRPWAVVDAVLAKRNVGTRRGMAPVVVGLGPGFTAGDDVHYVVETMRGHDLGRVIADGSALPNTGIPGLIAGRAAERVLHAPAAGVVHVIRGIGDIVEAGEVVCRIVPDARAVARAESPTGLRPEVGPVGRPERSGLDVQASIVGVIRGMIPDGYRVRARLKIADVDPRTELAASVDTISDKSRAVGGGALDAVLQGLHAAGLWGPVRR